ncbi:MAG: pyridoxamine 5'-phosphate oxidase family protein [Dehalococcoidia bacterium]
MAQHLEGIVQPTIHPRIQEFFRQQSLAFVSSTDGEGMRWASVVGGLPGFLNAVDGTTLHVGRAPTVSDPLHENLRVNADVGLLIIDFANRLRVRLNGSAQLRPDGTFYVHARQVYPNCSKYIQARRFEINTSTQQSTSRVSRSDRLTRRQQHWIKEADTFIIASAHQEGGADASHRGGNPGFITTPDTNTIIWPDYAGNMMFNTLGNISANPRAGLLFLDFDTGSTLQLTGEAKIVWDDAQIATYAGACRLVSFRAEQVLEISSVLPLRWAFEGYSPYNP